jgi:hypothetical protein
MAGTRTATKTIKRPGQKQQTPDQGPELKGWASIARFLGQPVSLVQRWSKTEQLPVEKKGRYVVTTKDALNRWLGHSRIPTSADDLTQDLKAALKSAKRAA